MVKKAKKLEEELERFRADKHDEEYWQWMTDYIAKSLRPEDVQDIHKPNREQKQREGQPFTIELKDRHGEIHSDPEKVANIFMEQVKHKLEEELLEITQERLQEVRSWATNYLEGLAAEHMDRLPSTGEIRKIVKALKQSASMDLTADELRVLLDTSVEALKSIIDRIWTSNGQEWVTGWNASIKIPLYKGKGKDPLSAASYRNITLCSIVKKVFTSIMRDRILVQVAKLVPDNHFGFLPGRGTVDGIAVLKTAIMTAKCNGTSLVVTFLDVKGAYPSVVREILMKVLRRAGMFTKKICDLTEKMYENTSMKIRVKNKLSEEYVPTRGLTEGCILSPFLWVIYLLAVFQHLREITPEEIQEDWGIQIKKAGRHTVRVRPEEVTWELLLDMAYADDICFFNETVKSAEDTMGYVVQALNDFGLDVDLADASKCRYMLINPVLKDPQLGREVDDVDRPYRLKGQVLTRTELYRYLGCMTYGTGKMTKELNSAKGRMWTRFKTRKETLCCRSLSIPAKMNLLQYHVLAYLYATQAWTMTKTETKKLDIEHRKMLRQMLNISRRSLEGQHMSDDDLYRACGTNMISKRIHGYIVVQAAKNLALFDRKSLRYQMMVLDEFMMLDWAIPEVPGIGRKLSGDVKPMKTLKRAMEALEISFVDEETGVGNMKVLDALHQFGKRKDPEAPDAAVPVYEWQNVKEGVKLYLQEQRNIRRVVYKGKRLPNFRFNNSILRDEHQNVVEAGKRNSENLVIYTDGSYNSGVAGWAFVPLHKIADGATLEPMYQPTWGEVPMDENHEYYVGARKQTNNTGELQAIAMDLR